MALSASSFAGLSEAACFSGVVVGFGLALLPGMDVFPSRISISLRFMARHIIWVSSRPEAPTMPPTATSSGSAMAMPAIAPATPLRELSREMVTGISAPPTRMVKTTPKAKARMSRQIPGASGSTLSSAQTQIRPTPMNTRSTPLYRECLGRMTGFWGRIWWSFPAATMLPEKVRLPTIRASPAVARLNRSGMPLPVSTSRATTAEAAPPRPLSNATICGI